MVCHKLYCLINSIGGKVIVFLR